MMLPRGLKVEDALLNEIGLEIARFAGKGSKGAILAELKDSIWDLGVECRLKRLHKEAFWLSVPSKAAYQCRRAASHARRHGLRKTISKIARVMAERVGID